MNTSLMINRGFIFLALILLTNQLYATDYYLSNIGDDNNKGTSPETAWKTIGKLNAVILKPGDKIYLNKGDAFVGELLIKVSGTTKNPIVISSYGIGEKPVLTGAVFTSHFESYTATIFQAKEENFIKTLFVNNEMQIIARYPNAGFLAFSSQDEFVGKSPKTRDNGEGKNVSQIRMKSLHQPDGYWNGASIRYRPIDWEWGFSELVNWKNGILTVKDSCRYGFSKGYGFIMENKMEELDTAGEWFYDKKAKMLYIWSETKPTTKVEAVVYDYGIKLADYVSNIEINNITFENTKRQVYLLPGIMII